MWERACSRWYQRGLADHPQRLHRGQARLPQVLRRTQNPNLAVECVGASLLAMVSARFTRPTAAPGSRASPAPTDFASHTKSKPCSGECGSEPARDGISAVYPTNRSACIAGKPGSHRFWGALQNPNLAVESVGASLLAMVSARFTRPTAAPASRASPAPTDFASHTESKLCSGECGSGLASDGISAVYPTNRSACIAGKPGSHRFFVVHRIQTLQWRVWEQQLPSTLPLVMHREPE